MTAVEIMLKSRLEGMEANREILASRLAKQDAAIENVKKQIICEHEFVSDNSAMQIVTVTCTKCGAQFED